MSADYRLIYRRARADGQVSCAEPSPDIGRIVSAAASGNLSGSAAGLAKVQPEIALAFAASRAEGLAQLGQRLATIQLLRDSTFRACEAFANQAISAATYAMIVSRYDDVMVTLLLAEIAAGAVRPPPASLTGTVATRGLSPTTGETVTLLATDRMQKATIALDQAVADRGRLKPDAPDAEKTAKQQTVDAARKEYDEASGLLKAALGSVGASQVVSAVSPAASDAPSPGTAVAEQLAKMQRAYLNDFNLDAVTVGCLSALSQLDQAPTTQMANPRGAAPSLTRDVATDAPDLRASLLVPQGQGTPSPGGERGFASSTTAGAWSLQDECRALLLNGQTLRAAARGRLEQIARNADEAGK